MVGPGRLNTDDHSYIEFKAEMPFPLSWRYTAENVRILAAARQPVWPWLVNVPAERQAAVKQELEKWFQATQHLMTAHYYGELLRASSAEGGLSHPDYWRIYRELTSSFERLGQLNPDDKNAEFLRKDWLASHEMLVAGACVQSGSPTAALTHLSKAIQIAGGTSTGARAQFYYGALARQLYDRGYR